MSNDEATEISQEIIREVAAVLRGIIEGKSYSPFYYHTVTIALEAVRDTDLQEMAKCWRVIEKYRKKIKP